MPANATPLDVFLLAVAGVGLPAWSFYSRRWYARRSPSARTRSSRYWLIAVRGVMLSMVVLGAWWKANRPFSALGLDVPVGLPGRVGFLIDVVIVGYYLTRVQFSRRSPEQLAATRDRLRRLGSYDMLPQTSREFAIFPIAAVAGSTCEELLYRGFLIGALAPAMGTAGAVVASSLLFGLGHLYQGRIGVLRTTVIGFAFGVAFTLTHSLWWLLIAHISLNLSGILLARRVLAESPELVSL
jgi:membrane protease YdiL (CAAX protease family)